jgi:hypothetical protein
MSILQDLYNSEINVSVESLWDCGFAVRIGDRLNGYRAEQQVEDWGAAEAWLRATAIRLYPKSEFARRYSLPPLRQQQLDLDLAATFGRRGGTA